MGCSWRHFVSIFLFEQSARVAGFAARSSWRVLLALSERSAHGQKHDGALRDQVGLRTATAVLPFLSGIMHRYDPWFSACCIIDAPPVQASTDASGEQWMLRHF